MDKSFSFGATRFRNAVPGIHNHQHTFRLVGGAIKLAGPTQQTVLGKKRCARWLRTVRAVGKLPVGWLAKVKSLKSTGSQLTYAPCVMGVKSWRVVRQCAQYVWHTPECHD